VEKLLAADMSWAGFYRDIVQIFSSTIGTHRLAVKIGDILS